MKSRKKYNALSLKLSDLTSEELSNLLLASEKKWGVLLPIGSLEQHGPLLPLNCDTAIAKGAAENLTMALTENSTYGAFVLPEFTYTPSPGAEEIRGTISVSFDWMGTGLKEIIGGALKTPWSFVGIINGHAHNHGRVIEAAMAAGQGMFGRRVPVVVINLYEFAYLEKKFNLSPSTHAGEFEIALFNYYVRDWKISNSLPEWKSSKKRPDKIYGLDILPRSNGGIISEKPPNLQKALYVSKELGKMIDSKVLDMVISNLDTYFLEWNENGVRT